MSFLTGWCGQGATRKGWLIHICVSPPQFNVTSSFDSAEVFNILKLTEAIRMSIIDKTSDYIHEILMSRVDFLCEKSLAHISFFTLSTLKDLWSIHFHLSYDLKWNETTKHFHFLSFLHCRVSLMNSVQDYRQHFNDPCNAEGWISSSVASRKTGHPWQDASIG